MPRRWAINGHGAVFEENEIDWDFLFQEQRKNWVLAEWTEDGTLTLHGSPALLGSPKVNEGIEDVIEEAFPRTIEVRDEFGTFISSTTDIRNIEQILREHRVRVRIHRRSR